MKKNNYLSLFFLLGTFNVFCMDNGSTLVVKRLSLSKNVKFFERLRRSFSEKELGLDHSKEEIISRKKIEVLLNKPKKAITQSLIRTAVEIEFEDSNESNSGSSDSLLTKGE